MASEFFMIVFGLLPMAITSFSSASSYDQDTKDVQAAVDAANKASDDVKAKFKAIADGQALLDRQILDDIDRNMSDIEMYRAKMQLAKTNAARRYIAIQTSGIIFITVILFLYILKSFGFLNDINHAIAGLF